MHFIDFARLHGILIDRLPPIGVWRRYPTDDKPRHRNGAVKFMDSHGFVQNHATETEISVWHSDGETTMSPERARKAVESAHRDIRDKQEQAAKKAAWILHQCQTGFHPYLEKKGFKDEQGNIYKTDDGLMLVIPMRVGHRLVGCQLIAEDGQKRFLHGQVTSNAEFVFDNHGRHVVAEGYATALSVRAALKSLKIRYTLHTTFSAGNMKKIIATLPSVFVVADHDRSGVGQKVATDCGAKYWISDQVGEDFNDFHQRVGLFKASQSLLKAMK